MSQSNEPYTPPGIQFFDLASERNMLLVTEGQCAGWLLYQRPDKNWVTLRKATPMDVAKINACHVVASLAMSELRPRTPGKPWPGDAMMVVSCPAKDFQFTTEPMRVVSRKCRDCDAEIVVNVDTIEAAEQHPARHDRPVKFFCIDCCITYDRNSIDMFVDDRKVAEQTTIGADVQKPGVIQMTMVEHPPDDGKG